MRATTLKPLALLSFLILSAVAAMGAYGGREAPAPTVVHGQADRGLPFPRPPRVAVLVLENRSYEQVIGSAKAPYVNRLAGRYALATQYYALTHPSLPNYIALTGGSQLGITDNCESCQVSARNLAGQLSAAGHTWKAYFEELGSNRRPGPLTSEYNPHYNPFVYFDTVSGVDSHRRRLVGFDDLDADLRHGRLPEFSWIAPSVLHDGHNSTLRQADRFASQLVPRVLRGLGRNGVLYLTWDEGPDSDTRGSSGSGGGRVPLIAAGDGARRRTRVSVRANHYALLRTIEAGFGLRALGNAGADSTPLLNGLLSGAPRTLGGHHPG